MRRAFILCLFVAIYTSVFSQKKDSSDSTKDKNNKEISDSINQGDSGQENKGTDDKETGKDDKQGQETRFKEGSSGVKRSIHYTFSTKTIDSDPGNGIFRYNIDIVTGITYIFIDDFDLSGADQTKWYLTWDDTTGAMGRGRINIVEYEGKNVNVFNINGVFIDAEGYWKIPVEYVSGILPADGATYYYVFERIANKEKTTAEEKKEKESTVEELAVSMEEQVIKTDTTIQQAKEEIVSAGVIIAAAATQPSAPVVQPEPAAPVVQPEPAAPVVQPEPAAPVVQPEPAAPVVQPEPAAPVVQANPITEERKAEETAVAVSVVTVAAGASEPKPERRVRTSQESKPETKTQTPQQTRVRNDSQQVQQSSPEPAQRTQVTETKTSAQEIQRQQPATEKKETPSIQTTSKTNQPQPVTKPPVEKPDPPIPSSQTIPSSSPGSPYTGYAPLKRTDGSRIWHGIIESGYGFKVSDYGINNYRINFISSFSFGKYFMLGIGVGYRRYFDKPEKHSEWYLVSNKNQIPVFLDLRVLLSKKQLTPYFALGLGGSTEKSKVDTTKYGTFINPSAGVWYRLSKNTALFAGIAYEIFELEYARPADNIPFRRKNNSVSLNIGIQF